MERTEIALTDRSDGVSSVVFEGKLIVYGGSTADRVWLLDLETLKWSAALCDGDVPPSRRFHSAAVYHGEMFVFGGEASFGEDDSLFALSLQGPDTHTWERIDAFGRPPAARAYHTASIVDDYMYIFGGRQTQPPSIASLRALMSTGFFDLYRLHLPTCTWEVFGAAEADAIHPYLWGHSACVFRHFLLFFGGFNVAIEEQWDPPRGSLADQQPPSATLNDVVYIFNTHNKQWTRSTPKGGGSPQPRALQCAFTFATEMHVFGGIALDHANRTAPVNDSWKWDIATGQWTQTEFCLKRWKSARLLFCVDGGVLHVLHSLTFCHRRDLRRMSQWDKLPCNPGGLARPQKAARPQPAAAQYPAAKRGAAHRAAESPAATVVDGSSGSFLGSILQQEDGAGPRAGWRLHGNASPPPSAESLFVSEMDPRSRRRAEMVELKRMSPTRRDANFEASQRAIIREEMRARLREELLNEGTIAKTSHIEAIQQQIGDLKGQISELGTLYRMHAQPPPRPPQPAPPVDESRGEEQKLTTEISRLVDAIGKLKQTSSAPFQPAFPAEAAGYGLPSSQPTTPRQFVPAAQYLVAGPYHPATPLRENRGGYQGNANGPFAGGGVGGGTPAGLSASATPVSAAPYPQQGTGTIPMAPAHQHHQYQHQQHQQHHQYQQQQQHHQYHQQQQPPFPPPMHAYGAPGDPQGAPSVPASHHSRLSQQQPPPDDAAPQPQRSAFAIPPPEPMLPPGQYRPYQRPGAPPGSPPPASNQPPVYQPLSPHTLQRMKHISSLQQSLKDIEASISSGD
ncbi:RING finger protein B [Diplonema papillatum]|nr:RING finger protein B [Diplonema papillatum]